MRGTRGTPARAAAARTGWRRRRQAARLRLDHAASEVIRVWEAYRDDPRSLSPVERVMAELADAYRRRHGGGGVRQ